MNKKRIIIILIVICILLCCVYYGNNAITISEYTIQSDKLVNIDTPIKIIHLSDLHNKEFGKDNTNLLELVKKEAPDIIVITGDFIDSSRTDTQVAIDLSKKLVEIADVYYVCGNHEKALNDNVLWEFEEEIRGIGVNVMNNSFCEYNEDIVIVGLDNDSLSSDDKSFEAIMENVDSQKYTILLAHEPQEIDWYASYGVDLVLSGHAHGGQIRIPFTNIGLIAPDQGFFPKYTAGEYIVDETTMIVSRGLGNSIIPVRVFNQPDIVKIMLSN
ncbi:MAG: metallophosphoesterase [Lachnospiraceae bacterium]|nr:metallophosphoesterase [Lachnospiraceae bacterium]